MNYQYRELDLDSWNLLLSARGSLCKVRNFHRQERKTMAETLLLSSFSCSYCGSGISGAIRRRLRATFSISKIPHTRTSPTAPHDSNLALSHRPHSLTPPCLRHVHPRPGPPPPFALDSSDYLPQSEVVIPFSYPRPTQFHCY